MNPFSFIRRNIIRGLVPYFALFALVAAFYFILNPFKAVNGGAPIRTIMVLGFCAVIIFLLVGYGYKFITFKHVIFAVILCGIILRIGYMSYTWFFDRNHDIEGIFETGHYAYMYIIFQTGQLPGSNVDQFYHPPLQHLLGAALARIVYFFRPDQDMDHVFDVVKILPCFASCTILPVFYRICSQLRLSKRATGIAVVIMAFHPTFFILSASVNNDTLMILFFLIAILYTIRWYQNPCFKNILLLALSIGLGMMTKLSMGVIALFTGPVFLIVLIKYIKKKQWKPLLGQFFAFAGVCFPLALWYPIRNLILFDQPLAYVLTIDNADLYRGGYTFAQRFLFFPFHQLLQPVYCDPFKDYNLWLYTIKCSLFGEFTFERPQLFAVLLIIGNVLLIAVSLISMIYVMIHFKDENPLARFGLFFIWAVQMLSFIQFNILFPFGCTMDFRYIVPTVPVGAIYIGMALDRLRESGKAWKMLPYTVGCGSIYLFSVASVLFYT